MMAMILLPLLALTVAAGLTRLLTAGKPPSRLDAVAMTVAAAAPAALLWQWPAGNAPFVGLACAALWFLWRMAAPRTVGRGAALYRFLFTGAAAWITVSLAGTQVLGPGGQLGGILLHMFAAVALLFAAAAWLLATFAVPAGAGGKPSPATGVHEALTAAALALCFFSLV